MNKINSMYIHHYLNRNLFIRESRSNGSSSDSPVSQGGRTSFARQLFRRRAKHATTDPSGSTRRSNRFPSTRRNAIATTTSTPWRCSRRWRRRISGYRSCPAGDGCAPARGSARSSCCRCHSRRKRGNRCSVATAGSLVSDGGRGHRCDHRYRRSCHTLDLPLRARAEAGPMTFLDPRSSSFAATSPLACH